MRKFENAYALIIGVDFKNESKGVLRDAQAIFDALIDEKLCGYDKDNISLLLHTDATRNNILAALNDIKTKSDENSSFLLYYSGHGGYDDEDNVSWLCPHDFDNENIVNGQQLPKTYITGEQLREQLTQMKSKRMFVLFDCCHAGSFFKGKDGTISDKISENTKQSKSNTTTTLEGIAQEIDDEKGMVIMASSQAEEHSWGDEDDENSIFTTGILEALKAGHLKHKTFLVDEFIRTVDTANYVFERTPQLFNKLKEKDNKQKKEDRVMVDDMQMPYANLQMSTDFALGYIPEELKHKVSIKKFPNLVKKAEKILSKSNSKATWERSEGNNLLLFVHGLSGESKDTFGSIPSMLQSDANFEGWAMKPLGYTPIVQPKLGKDIWGAILDVDKIAGFLKTSIKHRFKKYDRIAIVAHSLGGLVAQKAILALDDDNRNRISHLIMFGTPSKGISPDVLSQQWNKKYSEMSSEGQFITTLRIKWNNTFGDSYPFKLKVAASTDDEYVTLESCHGPFDEKYREFVEKKHIDMVKPASTEDATYSLIVSTLTGSKFFNKFTNKEKINLTLGKYDAVVKELLPIKDELDKVGLTQLIFALEGLERKEEVYDILNNHSLAKDNTDLMGILGGRHKRDYLKKPTTNSSNLSIEYYSKALDISVKNEDYAQIYYHAINLAFLSIVTDPTGGESKMTKYAKQALEATEQCRDDVWKYGTVAEASMYVGDMDKAKEYYIKASEKAAIREKISMHTNAYAGYVALEKTDNPEDEFIQFLKERLLS